MLIGVWLSTGKGDLRSLCTDEYLMYVPNPFPLRASRNPMYFLFSFPSRAEPSFILFVFTSESLRPTQNCRMVRVSPLLCTPCSVSPHSMTGFCSNLERATIICPQERSYCSPLPLLPPVLCSTSVQDRECFAGLPLEPIVRRQYLEIAGHPVRKRYQASH